MLGKHRKSCDAVFWADGVYVEVLWSCCYDVNNWDDAELRDNQFHLGSTRTYPLIFQTRTSLCMLSHRQKPSCLKLCLAGGVWSCLSKKSPFFYVDDTSVNMSRCLEYEGHVWIFLKQRPEIGTQRCQHGHLSWRVYLEAACWPARLIGRALSYKTRWSRSWVEENRIFRQS